MTNEQRKKILTNLPTNNELKSNDESWFIGHDRLPVNKETGDCAEHNKRLIDTKLFDWAIDNIREFRISDDSESSWNYSANNSRSRVRNFLISELANTHNDIFTKTEFRGDYVVVVGDTVFDITDDSLVKEDDYSAEDLRWFDEKLIELAGEQMDDVRALRNQMINRLEEE